MASTMSKLPVLAAATLGCLGIGYHFLVVKKKEPRKGKINCACGKIEIALHQPAANYTYMDAPCLGCGCDDCVNYCKKVLEVGSSNLKIEDMGVPGIDTTILYDSEMQVTRGQSYLQSMKLSQNSDNRRIYSTCCGTPILISSESAPVNLVYCCNMKGEKDGEPSTINVTPACCVHAPENSKAPEGSKMRIAHGTFAPIFILNTIGRLLLLVFAGSYGPGTGVPIGDGKEMEIGMDTIKVNNSQ